MSADSSESKTYKVTAVAAQVNNPDRVSISIDGKYKFSLTIYQVVDLGVKIGREYDEQELAELEQEGQFGKLYARALEYCLMRPHSSREVRDYLWRKTQAKMVLRPSPGRRDSAFAKKEAIERPGVSQAVADRVYERLIEKSYVDDLKFALWWVENRHLRKGVSRRKLEAELISKGVNSSIIAEALGGSERNDESELQKVIAKKRTRYSDPQKLKQYLLRQGFSYEDVRSALDSDGD